MEVTNLVTVVITINSARWEYHIVGWWRDNDTRACKWCRCERDERYGDWSGRGFLDWKVQVVGIAYEAVLDDTK